MQIKLSCLVFASLILALALASISCASSSFSADSDNQNAVRLAPDVRQEMLDASYWISKTRNPYKIKMTKEQIAFWNKQVVQATMPETDSPYLVSDLRKFDSVISSAELRISIIHYNQSISWYTKRRDEIYRLTESDWHSFYEKMHFAPLGTFAYFSGRQKNPGVEAMDFPVRKAIVVRRSDLRLVPDDTVYTDDNEYWYDDTAQNSGILMNEPVLVLWTSADKKWFFVKSNFCNGWIHREDVAFCTDKEFERYFDYAEQPESSFITITADRFVLPAEYTIPQNAKDFSAVPELFMGTYLHTADWNDERFSDIFSERTPYASYIAEIPYKKADESLGIAYASVPGGICTEGLLEFTAANTLTLAFKPLGNRYGWGGMNDSRDCSEYLKDIFRCFGFMLPRNSRLQMAMPGETIAFRKKSNSARKSAISSLEAGAILGFPGHVFMYLGKEKGNHYVISALGAYYPDGKTIEKQIDVNSVNVNTVEVVRKNGKNWLENLTHAKSFADDGSFVEYEIPLNPKWKYADFSKINTGSAYLYKAKTNRRNITIAVNAGHGAKDGNLVKTYSHPDKSPKLTGGTDPAGVTESTAISGGMQFADGKTEAEVNLRTARFLKDALLKKGFDVLMIRDSDDTQLDNIARTVISNNNARIHIAIHFDSDAQTEDKGCFYCGVPPDLRKLFPVKKHWKESERLGQCLIDGLRNQNLPIYQNGSLEVDLTQTSYSTIPTVDIELGNQHTPTDTESLKIRVDGLVMGILQFFSK